MKTYKNLYKELCSNKNFILAFKKARKGKTKKNYVIKFESKFRYNLKKLQKELINKTYQPSLQKEFIIRDPKTRKIHKSTFRDRIIHHAIINIIEPIFEKRFIYDSYASRKRKGQHKALKRFDFFKRKASKNGKRLKGIKDNNYICGYCLKADIAKYFESVNHNILINIIKNKIADKDIIWLIKQILNNHPTYQRGVGMSLGNYTSQFFANIYLNELDYYIKHNLKAKYYLRYVDDFVILHNSKEQLELYKDKINFFLKENLKIELHQDKSKIIPLHQGTKLLGFRVFYYHKLVRESNIYQMKKNLKIWKEQYKNLEVSYEKLVERLDGWFAHISHGSGYNLQLKFSKIFGDYFH